MKEQVKSFIFIAALFSLLLLGFLGILVKEFEKPINNDTVVMTTNTKRVIVYYRDVVGGYSYIHFLASDDHEYISYNHGLVHSAGCRAQH